MIVIIQKDTQEPALRQLAVRLMNQGVRIGRTPGRDSDVLTLVGDTWRLDPEGLAAAKAVIFFLIVMAITFIQVGYTRKKEVEL